MFLRRSSTYRNFIKLWYFRHEHEVLTSYLDYSVNYLLDTKHNVIQFENYTGAKFGNPNFKFTVSCGKIYYNAGSIWSIIQNHLIEWALIFYSHIWSLYICTIHTCIHMHIYITILNYKYFNRNKFLEVLNIEI